MNVNVEYIDSQCQERRGWPVNDRGRIDRLFSGSSGPGKMSGGVVVAIPFNARMSE